MEQNRNKARIQREPFLHPTSGSNGHGGGCGWWHHLGSQIYKKWSQKPKVVFGSTSIWWFPLLCWYCYGLVRTKLLQWSLQSCSCSATAGVWRCALGNTTLRDIWHILPRKYQPCVNYLFPGWAGCWGGECVQNIRGKLGNKGVTRLPATARLTAQPSSWPLTLHTPPDLLFQITGTGRHGSDGDVKWWWMLIMWSCYGITRYINNNTQEDEFNTFIETVG